MDYSETFAIWEDSPQRNPEQIRLEVAIEAAESILLSDENTSTQASPRSFDPRHWPTRTIPHPHPNLYDLIEVDLHGLEWIPRLTEHGIAHQQVNDGHLNRTHRQPLQSLDNYPCSGRYEEGQVEIERPTWHLRPPGIGRQTKYDERGAAISDYSHQGYQYEFQIYEDDQNLMEAEEWSQPAAIFYQINTAQGEIPLLILYHKEIFELILELPVLHSEEQKKLKRLMEKAVKYISILFHGLVDVELYDGAVDLCRRVRLCASRDLRMSWTAMIETATEIKETKIRRETQEAEKWNEGTRRRRGIYRKEEKFGCCFGTSSKDQTATSRTQEGGKLPLSGSYEYIRLLRV